MKHTRMHTIYRRQVGINVGAIREEKGLSQADLAVRADVDRSYISRLENARGNLSLDKLVSIAYGLDVPITALFDGLEGHSPQELYPYDYTIAGLPRRKGRIVRGEVEPVHRKLLRLHLSSSESRQAPAGD